ncbi:hypothetical protein M441DRAFT_365793 [Trichoderma asperellum CBS 433.97]|uniref:Uncharacterized protein n=1 Tax=Trichoderma asperellum (strain ATCC 204424 / CBS 433.97 / NBRC 101777) TaxID=1042311 RepID=A0A2T3ZE63_TRIA4|nr:hypothetical protein M441DRAFT_365793 [Trichoderma asperellum CBS 433.97]PTB43097.1 hypothetical protein M441DRAFT_365793 [Trichoderma asperellum CBS 433.97]
MASLRERIRMHKRRAQQARGKRGMTMRILLQHGHLDGWGYPSLNQGREKKTSMVVAGLTRPGKKKWPRHSRAYQAERPDNSRKMAFSFFFSSLGLPKKRLAGRIRTTLQ